MLLLNNLRFACHNVINFFETDRLITIRFHTIFISKIDAFL